MRSLNSFANHVSSLSAQTVQTRAHRFHSLAFKSSGRSVSANPAKFLFSNPALLSARWSYPNSAPALSVNDCQAPLSIQINHVAVGNQDSSKWIDDFDYIISQNEFGFYPKNVNGNAKNEAENQVAGDLKIVANNPECVHSKKGYQQISSTGPNKVASRSKGFIHHPSIAGERK
jgi:hypothetical protein